MTERSLGSIGTAEAARGAHPTGTGMPPGRGIRRPDLLAVGTVLPRRRNWPLVIGAVLALLVGFLAMAGPALAPRDPLETHTVVMVGQDWIRLPYPPFTVPGFLLGSDTYGRDLLSRLLWGVRPTMILVVIVALVRLLLGLVLGLSAGWSTGRLGHVLEVAIAGAMTVPVVIVALAVITAVGIQHGLRAFLLGLAITGWAETARLVSEQTRSLKSMPFVEAARALGASGTEMLARHILRHIAPMLGMLLAFEAGSTLMAIAALGFLGYYLGGAFWIEVTDFSGRAISGLPELGQMLANSWQIFKPWATVATGTVVFIAVLAFNLIGEGLRRRLSMDELGRRTAFSDLAGRVGAWVDELLLLPGVQAERRRRVIGAIVAVLAVVMLLVFWQPWRATPGSTALQSGEQPALPVAGGHLWATERRDAYGTLASSVSDLVPPKVRWILPDASGFSGGPAVDAEGNIYATSNAGTLYALTPAGEMLWQIGLPAEPVGALALGLSSPTRPQDEGTLYVTDKAGGLAAFTPGGDFLWRFRTQTGRRASSGPVVGADGTIYYTVVDRVEAVTPEGKSLWTSQRLPGHGETAPRLDPAGNWLYVQDVVVKMADGSLADFSTVVPSGRAGVDAVYFIGGDGRNYLRESHAIFPWRQTASGGERIGQLTWNYQGSVIYLPMDSGVTRQGSAWLRYGSQWDDLRLVLLSKDGRLLTNAHYPQRSSQVIAADGADRIYLCGANRTSNPECIAFAAGSEQPIWQVSLTEGGQVNGGALVPGRLYVTTADGFLYAIGDE